MALFPELDKSVGDLTEQMRAALERAFQAGVRHGRELERTRMRELLFDEQSSKLGKTQDVANPVPHGAQDHGTANAYGAVSGAVRTALHALARTSQAGVGPAEVTDYCQNQINAPVAIRQVLTALKQMAKRGEAIRVSRGRYLPKQKDGQGDPGVSAPGPINQLELQEVSRVASDGEKIE